MDSAKSGFVGVERGGAPGIDAVAWGRRVQSVDGWCVHEVRPRGRTVVEVPDPSLPSLPRVGPAWGRPYTRISEYT